MWKSPIVFLLLISFAATTFSKALIVFGFYLNQPEIAATLCENRNKPVMQCGGKCQLAKQFKQEERKAAQNPDLKAENKTEIISSRSFYAAALPANIIDAAINHFDHTAEGKPVQRSFSVFHPPISLQIFMI